MIPQEQLQTLKPLQGQEKARQLVKSHSTIHYRKGKNVLSRIQRSRACYPEAAAKGGYSQPDYILRNVRDN